MIYRAGVVLLLLMGAACGQDAAPAAPEAEAPAPANEASDPKDGDGEPDEDEDEGEWTPTSRPTNEARANKKEARLRLRRGLYHWKLEDEDDAYRDWRKARELDLDVYEDFRADQSPDAQSAMDTSLTVDPDLRTPFHIQFGLWWNSNLDMDMRLGSRVLRRLTTEIDVRRFLNVRRQTISDFIDADQRAVADLGLHYQGKSWRIGVWGTLPYKYVGTRITETRFEFGDTVIELNRRLESQLSFWHIGFDFSYRFLKEDVFEFSPALRLAALAFDWEFDAFLTGTLQREAKIRTSELYEFLPVGDYELLPYPEIGFNLKLGPDWLHATIEFMGIYIYWLDLEGATFRLDAKLEWFPHPNLGLFVGYRYIVFDIASQQTRNYLEFDAQFQGVTTGLTFRF